MGRSREIDDLRRRLAATGASLTLRAPGFPPLGAGTRPDAAGVSLRTERAFEALLRRDHLRLAEAYLAEELDVEGDWLEVMKAADVLDLEPSPWTKLSFAVRLLLPGRRRWNRRSIAFHYDRPAEFFLPWLDRWRSYSHGFYRSPGDGVSEAQARKMQYAIDALGLAPGMEVLDMGAGWGCFVEYAGLRGISVHGITISKEQHRFVSELIDRRRLPCTVELVDFVAYRPRRRFDGAVFMGTLEHVPDYARVARFLAEHLEPEARVYADFCAQRESFLVGAFMRKHLWPGTATYVNLPKLLRALVRAGFNVHELADDTRSYACTVRDWADALEAHCKELAERFGEPTVRTFLLFLQGSYHFLLSNRTQAYHLVAGRKAAPLASAP